MTNRTNRVSVLAVLALAACSGDATKTQVVTGQVSERGAIAVRAVSGDTVISAAQLRSDGSFTLALPSGNRYRLEVLTAAGVKHIYARETTGLHALAFKVCRPAAPWNIGAVKAPAGSPNDNCDPTTDPNCQCDATGNCGGGGGGCDPTTDPNCGGGGGGGNCDPLTDPNCKCDATGNCNGGCDPQTDPNCGGTCDPTTDPNCGGNGGGCDPATDPYCVCDAAGNCKDGNCDPTTDPNCNNGGGCTDPDDPNCGGGGGGGGNCDWTTDPNCKCDPNTQDCNGTGGGGGCDPTTDPNCQCDAAGNNCGVYCTDPNDPSTCKDTCMSDPSTCGCNGDPGCWGDGTQPPKCDAAGNCSADGALMPDHPPGDFGCVESQ